mmetsp:Transcript_101281/g.255065  ORF Transcript_101281/g.255065 Transcript_101281/m.255065 type:complete len:265 (-) Transcript_101281:1131-1925(-)
MPGMFATACATEVAKLSDTERCCRMVSKGMLSVGLMVVSTMRDPADNATATSSGRTASPTSAATATLTASRTAAKRSGRCSNRTKSMLATLTEYVRKPSPLMSAALPPSAAFSSPSGAATSLPLPAAAAAAAMVTTLWSMACRRRSFPSGCARREARSRRTWTWCSKVDIWTFCTKAGSGGLSSSSGEGASTSIFFFPLDFLSFLSPLSPLLSFLLSFLPLLASGPCMAKRLREVCCASHCLYCFNVPRNFSRISSDGEGYSKS